MEVTETALGLVLVAACAHAAWNLAAKRAGDGGALFVWLYYSLSALVCAPVALAWALVTLPDPQWIWLGAAALTAALHVGYGVVLQRGYATGDMSVVYPTARGTGPLLAALVAVTLLGERPGTVGLVGALLVIAGVVVIGSGGARRAPARGRRLGLAYGLATGVFIAGYTLWDAHAVTALAIPPLVYFTIATALEGVFLLPRALADRERLPGLVRAHWREALVVGLLSPLAYLLVLYAFRLAPVALVAPARESSIVLGSLLGLVALREGGAPRKLAGAALVFAGIVAIGLS
jgi:drug/metabolite transporter (DMT)-like permease